MRHLAYIVAIVLLLGLTLKFPTYLPFAAVGGAIATGIWFYLSLRHGRAIRGNAAAGVTIVGFLVVAASLVAANSITHERDVVSATVTGCINSNQRNTGHGALLAPLCSVPAVSSTLAQAR